MLMRRHSKPSRLWLVIGAIMLVHFGAMVCFKWSRGVEGELLWFSHAGLLLGAIALLMRSTRLASLAFVLVAGFHMLWFADACLGLTTGRFPVGGTRYLLDADAATLALTSHHLYLAPTLVAFLVKRHAFHAWSIPASVALMLTLSAASRLTLPESMNINYAHAVFPASPAPVFVWFNALPTPGYLGMHTLFCMFVFLIPGAIIMKMLIPARRRVTRTPDPARVGATRVLATLGRGRGFTLIELIAVLVVLAVLSGVALPRYFDYSSQAKASADLASIAAINTALNDTFLQHRMHDADAGNWITAAVQVASVMEGGELPYGITLNSGAFVDQRGNAYNFIAETSEIPARLELDNNPGEGGGGGGGGGGNQPGNFS